jgi:hypothetical protein
LGFASAEGTEELNRDLSNKRAISVLDYINHKGIVRRRIVAKGYGATKDQTSTKEEGRRVEVNIVDLNALEPRIKAKTQFCHENRRHSGSRSGSGSSCETFRLSVCG